MLSSRIRTLLGQVRNARRSCNLYVPQLVLKMVSSDRPRPMINNQQATNRIVMGSHSQAGRATGACRGNRFARSQPKHGDGRARVVIEALVPALAYSWHPSQDGPESHGRKRGRLFFRGGFFWLKCRPDSSLFPRLRTLKGVRQYSKAKSRC